MNSAEYVKTKIADGVAEINFAHPKSNSLPADLLKQLAEAFKSASADPSANVIYLTSAGEKAFCAGASFDELCQINCAEAGKEFFMGFAKVVQAMVESSKPIVTKVQGKVVGGGVGLVAASDYVLATESASIRLSELAIGIGPFVIGPIVQAKVGRAHFMNLSLDAEWRSADWCLASGLYSQTFKTSEELSKATKEFLIKLKGYNPEALKELKMAFQSELPNDLEQLLENRAAISGRLILSQFSQNILNSLK